VTGNAVLLSPFKNGAGFDLQVMGRFGSGEPMAVHVKTPFRVLPNTLQCLILRCVFYDRSKQLTSALLAQKRPRSKISRLRGEKIDGGLSRNHPQDFTRPRCRLLSTTLAKLTILAPRFVCRCSDADQPLAIQRNPDRPPIAADALAIGHSAGINLADGGLVSVRAIRGESVAVAVFPAHRSPFCRLGGTATPFYIVFAVRYST